MTKYEMAKEIGLESFDCALPQDWLDQVATKRAQQTGEDFTIAYEEIRGSTVWCYDGSICGYPFDVVAAYDERL